MRVPIDASMTLQSVGVRWCCSVVLIMEWRLWQLMRCSINDKERSAHEASQLCAMACELVSMHLAKLLSQSMLADALASSYRPMTAQVCTNTMNLGDEVDLEDYVSRPDKISAAEISAICQEAGMHAVRKNRWVG